MPKLAWYWHRLRAMGPREIAARVRKKVYQAQDARRLSEGSTIELNPGSSFPSLPEVEAAPAVLRDALASDAEEILAGRWKAFGHLAIQVDDPPRWHQDYVAGFDLATTASAFKLDHRELPGGADIRLIWELSRWNQLVRLAQAAYVLEDERSARKCVAWLANWVERNPPYRGWNWTSALEVGVRLVQIAWIDALLTGYMTAGGNSARSDAVFLAPQGEGDAFGPRPELRTSVSHATTAGVPPLSKGEGRGEGRRSEPVELRSSWQQLRREVLPPHVWYAWRYRSFGSSANNHLIGELAGLISAVVRWPALATMAAPLGGLQRLWEREVLAQFAPDGGNREQALNYHLFAWEFCWEASLALRSAGRKISPEVEDRLQKAANFFVAVQSDKDRWDYGDSDNAFVTPLFMSTESPIEAWRSWFRFAENSNGVGYWLGKTTSVKASPGAGRSAGWAIYAESGIAVHKSDGWFARWDVSPLGYLSPAAHGHLDALHFSLWRHGVAMIIDPGTGAYYADIKLRSHLSSWDAHNGPHPTGADFPKRAGPFLWSRRHAEPNLKPGSDAGLSAELRLPSGVVRRKVTLLPREQGWQVEDSFEPASERSAQEFSVRWQFAPGAKLERLAERKARVSRQGVSIEIEVSEDWAEVMTVSEQNGRPPASTATREEEPHLAGTVSPAFRKTEWAPFLKLAGRRGDRPCVFRTTFLASARS